MAKIDAHGHVTDATLDVDPDFPATKVQPIDEPKEPVEDKKPEPKRTTRK